MVMGRSRPMYLLYINVKESSTNVIIITTLSNLSADVSPMPYNKHKNKILVAAGENDFTLHIICRHCFGKAHITTD